MDLNLISVSSENTAQTAQALALYADIREKDRLGRQNLFIAEGKVVLANLLESRRFSAQSLLVSERKLPNLLPLLAKSRPQCPIYVAEQAVLDNIAGFAVHRGILAAGKRPPSPHLADFLAAMPPNALLTVLSGLSNHDNVGAVFRNAAAFAADSVILDERCCDPLYRKAIRVSVGAVLRVPYCQSAAIADIAAALKQAGFAVFAFSGQGERDLSAAAAQYQRRRAAGAGQKTALLFGSEGEGLPAEILDSASPLYVPSLRIPIAADFDSLNIATAAGIALAAFADPAKLR